MLETGHKDTVNRHKVTDVAGVEEEGAGDFLEKSGGWRGGGRGEEGGGGGGGGGEGGGKASLLLRCC